MNMSFVISERNRKMMNELCNATHVPKSQYINAALEEYLEDQLDILEATEILANTKPEDFTEFNCEEYL